MTCQEFRDRLHEYLDETLEAGSALAAREHLARCPECRLAVQQEQRLGRTLEHVLERAAADVALSRDVKARILHAARTAPARAPLAVRALEWFARNLFHAIGASAAFMAAVLFALQLGWPHGREQAASGTRGEDRINYTIDVPFLGEQHTGVTHAEFSNLPGTPSTLR